MPEILSSFQSIMKGKQQQHTGNFKMVSAIWIMHTKESMVECQVIDTRSILNWHLMDIYGQTLEWHLINTLVNIQLGVDYIICRHTMECWLKHE